MVLSSASKDINVKRLYFVYSVLFTFQLHRTLFFTLSVSFSLSLSVSLILIRSPAVVLRVSLCHLPSREDFNLLCYCATFYRCSASIVKISVEKLYQVLLYCVCFFFAGALAHTRSPLRSLRSFALVFCHKIFQGYEWLIICVHCENSNNIATRLTWTQISRCIVGLCGGYVYMSTKLYGQICRKVLHEIQRKIQIEVPCRVKWFVCIQSRIAL